MIKQLLEVIAKFLFSLILEEIDEVGSRLDGEIEELKSQLLELSIIEKQKDMSLKTSIDLLQRKIERNERAVRGLNVGRGNSELCTCKKEI